MSTPNRCTELSCSFCGKTRHEVRVLVAGPAVYICDECIYLSAEIVGEHGMSADDRREYEALAAALPYLERMGAPSPPMRSCDPKGDRLARAVLDRMEAIRDRVTTTGAPESVALPDANESHHDE